MTNVLSEINSDKQNPERLFIFVFEAYKIAEENLQMLYTQHFLKTRSYQALSNTLKRYEKINERLFAMGMTEINLNTERDDTY